MRLVDSCGGGPRAVGEPELALFFVPIEGQVPGITSHGVVVLGLSHCGCVPPQPFPHLVHHADESCFLLSGRLDSVSCLECRHLSAFP